MKDSEFILGLFFSDENNLVFDNIKFSDGLSQDTESNLKMISYKFLGPLFLTSANSSGTKWKIEFIESSLSLLQGRTLDVDIIQSFFNINSTIESEEGLPTHLSAMIGSPHTEDTKLLFDKLVEYIHPSIIQGRIVNESLLGGDFIYKNFIKEELERGLNLLQFSLGSARKMYWEEQQKYYCVAVIERIIEKNSKSSYLYTFYKDDLIRKQFLSYIPSYYIMAILPDYYENLIHETLKLFNMTSIYPNVRTIRVSHEEKQAIYIEEHLVEDGFKKSWGVILIPENEFTDECNNLAFYKRNLRAILDVHKDPIEIIRKINPQISFEKYSTSSEKGLNEITEYFDNAN
ncbi:MAG: hypothetical protein ACFFAH_04060 [Promethearchaeota archaeon]